jgi:pilus assembly protein Flp/PilA
VGAAEGSDGLSDAARRCAARADAARSSLGAFARDTRGSTAIEYALVASLIAVVIVGAVAQLGSNVKALFDKIVF